MLAGPLAPSLSVPSLFPSTQHAPCDFPIPASGSWPSLPLGAGALHMPLMLQNNYTVNLWHNITNISKDERLIKSSSLAYKSHLEITLKYHIQVHKEKANVILMNSEFIQLLNHRIRVLGWTFFKIVCMGRLVHCAVSCPVKLLASWKGGRRTLPNISGPDGIPWFPAGCDTSSEANWKWTKMWRKIIETKKQLGTVRHCHRKREYSQRCQENAWTNEKRNF